MTRDEARREIVSILETLAPEVDLSEVDPRADLREEVDLDSMDFLRAVVLIHDRLGVDVPEADYASVRTLDALVAYVAARAGDRDAEAPPPP